MAGTTDKTAPHRVCACTRTAPQLLTVPEAGARLGLSRSAVYRRLGDGRIETVRWGGTTRISEPVLAAFIRAATVVGL